MPKKSKISSTDINTFLDAVKGVKPLIQDKISLKKSIKKPHKPSMVRPRYEEEMLFFDETPSLTQLSGDEFISYKQNSISDKTLRKLRKGQYTIQATIDLHGMTIEEARSAVSLFLQDCFYKEIQVALIIHGRGLHSKMPILKNKLNQWLRSTPLVLAFCSATKGHGSRGAIYVLFKRPTKEDLLG